MPPVAFTEDKLKLTFRSITVMNKKVYEPMQAKELGSLASLTQGMAGIYPDGNSGMGMSFPAGMDDGMFEPDMGGLI